MALNFGQIVLYSNNFQELSKFLGDLLDLEIHTQPQGDGVLLHNKILRISIIKSTAQQIFAKSSERDMMIDFYVESLDELEDYLHKVQFMNYRKGDSFSTTAKVQLSKVGNNYFFLVRDPDGRRWKFSFKENLQSPGINLD